MRTATILLFSSLALVSTQVGCSNGEKATETNTADFTGGIAVVAAIPPGPLPFPVSFSDRGPDEIVVDDHDVYFSNVDHEQIFKAPKNGGTPSLLSDTHWNILSLALGPSHVYAVLRYQNDIAIGQVPKGGGPVRILYEKTLGSLSNLVVDGNTLYYAQDTVLHVLDAPSGNAHELYPGALRGGSSWVAASATELYWIDGGVLWHAGKSGTLPPAPIMQVGHEVGSHNISSRLAVDGDEVFLTSRSITTLRRVHGGIETALFDFPSAADPSKPLVSGANIYVGSGVYAADGSFESVIYRVPRAGGAADIFARGFTGGWGFRGFAQDSSYVYWGVPSNTAEHALVVRKAK